MPSDFPHLTPQNHAVTSQKDKRYNCIAWAAADHLKWWWPIQFYYWPRGVPREKTLAAFSQAFATLGYEPCASESYEAGFEKVAIFTDANGVPTHAARQLDGNNWTSKLGQEEDIRHALRAVEGPRYGRVAAVLRRPVIAPPSA